VWHQLTRLSNAWRGRVLTVAPELTLSGPGLSLMAELGLRQLSPRTWESIWVDLRQELEALRNRQDGKWRDMLTFSEKAGLDLEIGSDDQLCDWMMGRYQTLMNERNFSGPPIDLLLSLRKYSQPEENLLIVRALHGGQPVAGICLARRGAAATYLLRWNGREGRKLRANQYLLWQAQYISGSPFLCGSTSAVSTRNSHLALPPSSSD